MGGVAQDDASQDNDTEDDGSRRRPPLRIVALLVLGAVFGALGVITWSVEPSARSVSGTVGAIDQTGSALLLAEPEELAETGLGLVGVLWRDAGGEWRRSVSDDGFPTCLTPDDVGRQVTIGLVTDPGGVDRPPSEVVAWIECGPPDGGSEAGR